jgi:hypothetical protein
MANGPLKQNIAVGVGVGIGIGLGLAVLAPSAFPHAARAARPYAKWAVKSAMVALMQAREGVAEFREYTEDLVAETKAEMVEERTAAARAAAEATAGETSSGEPLAGD